MKNIIIILFFLPVMVIGQVNYSDYFNTNTLRFDYNRCGTVDTEEVFFEQMIKEGKWSGPKANLIDPFNWGEYKVELRDAKTNKLIYSEDTPDYTASGKQQQKLRRLNVVFTKQFCCPIQKTK